MDRLARQLATEKYRQARRRRRIIGSIILALIAASVLASYSGTLGKSGDDWSRFDHRSFRVLGAEADDSLRIALPSGSTEIVKLLGIASADGREKAWLDDRTRGRSVTLLLHSPQTRNASGRLLAFVFLDESNLSVELAREGLVYADRREKTAMDALIDPAESEARKKKRGIWTNLKFEQMPQWRKDWLQSLPGHGEN